MFIYILVSIFIISLIWAIFSLRGFKKNSEAQKEVKDNLQQGRVLFQKTSPTNYGSSSSEDSLSKES